MKQFSDVNLPPQLSSSLAEMGFITPTPIQCEAIPIALEGKDILGSAQTGTGKTGAFGIPLIASLLNNPEGGAMVLLPTRELAVQVMDALRKMLGNTQIRTALLIGGQSMFKQFNQLRSKPRIVVGTPGRINDHLKRKTLNLDKTNFLVLDETDRMLDMGFGIQLKEISKHLTAKRQTLMFSATLPSNIKKLSAEYLTDPVRISVGETSAPAINIKQEHAFVSESEKFPRLLDELNSRKGSIIIFVKTKHGAAKLAEKLTTYGHETDAIHGNLRQNKRDSVIGNFRKEKYRILVATDVACRGLDIPHIEHVINYDIPQASEDYIHRIGRTARAGAQGSALSLLSPGDNAKWRAIQFLLDPTKKLEPLPRGSGGGNGGGRGNDRNRARKGGFKRWERKSGDRPEGQGERRSSFGGGDRRKSFGTPRSVADGESRPSRDGEQRPEGQGERRPFNGDRRKSFGSGSARPSGDGERRSSFGGGDRRKSFGNSPRPTTDGDERRPSRDGEQRREGRSFNGDRRKSFGSARPSGNGERRPTLGLDRPSGDGERRSRPDGERKSSFGSERRSFGGDRRKSFGGGIARPSGQGDRRKSFGGGDRRKAAA